MRIAGSVLTLICGIVVLVGVFMLWAPVGFFTVSGSGWDIIDKVGVQPFMVLMAGIAVIGFALPSFIVSMVTRGGKAAVVTLSALASIASIVALGGAIWFIIDVLTSLPNFQLSAIGYGVYISAAAALVGMIFGFVTMSAAIAAKPRPRVARYAAAPAPAPVTAPPPAPVVTMHAAPVVAPPPPAPVAATPPPLPPPPPPPAPKPAAKKVKAEPAFTPAAAEPVVEEAKAKPAPKKPKKPAVEKVEEAPAAKPEGIDESTLPMVQQPWETPEEFRARRKRRTVQF